MEILSDTKKTFNVKLLLCLAKLTDPVSILHLDFIYVYVSIHI